MHGVYGSPSRELVSPPGGAAQFSPLQPGSQPLEERAERSLDSFTALAPPGTIERRYLLALALSRLRSGGSLTALAPKDKGGARLKNELSSFGCEVTEESRGHHKICFCRRPERPVGLEEALAMGAPRFDPALGLWTQPGVFSWNRPDRGSSLLLSCIPPLRGRGVDLGAGLGVLSRAVLSASPEVRRIFAVELDRRAVECARRNLADSRAEVRWADARGDLGLCGLDFVVSNPPFHEGGREDRGLGQDFLRQAAHMLRPGGSLWLVANRHLPYEAILSSLFTTTELRAESGEFKAYEAVR